MKTKVHIQMFGTYENYDAIVDRESFVKAINSLCPTFVYIKEMKSNKVIAVNLKYVAWIEFDEVKE